MTETTETFEDKVNNIGELSESQKIRNDLTNHTYRTLVDFLTTYINQLSNETDLRSTIETELLTRVEDQDEKISTTALINILKVLKDSQNMGAKGILDVLKVNTQVNIENNIQNPPSRDSSNMSLEETKKAKHILEILEKFSITEFSMEEPKK